MQRSRARRARAATAALGALPLVVLAVRAVGWAGWDLGANPVETLTHTTGLWALRFLLASLAVTPLRHALRAPWLAPLRRTLGLWAFTYAALHLAIWLVLDLDLEPGNLLEEVAKRPFVTLGLAAFLLLLPLALTSTRGWQRRLGRRWLKLHRLAYVAAFLAVLHFLWLVKADWLEPGLYAAALALLLGLRRVDLGGRGGGRRSVVV